MSSDWEEKDGEIIVTQHHLPEGVGSYDDLYFPINHYQIRDILGKILTQVEAMNLQPKSESATKIIFTQMVWRWFDEVMSNSATSSQGCIAPIKIVDCQCDKSKNSSCHKCAVNPPIKVVRVSIGDSQAPGGKPLK